MTVHNRSCLISRFDAREKSMLSYATHYSNEAVFGQRAQMRVNLEIGKAILVVEHLQVKNLLDFGLNML